ncbi:hypothetical protein CBM2598_U30019 [Cupriavidus taiwanensis]|uniref:Uncharacterized protein n=1 Tax=Cupriavidus taiwanensis TaxID=164546 RepID=A0A7Z7JG43_9BURK|nr:hypothetical protein CBM2598_U30019 [Cupriavidus taiwanensis]SPC25961.1 hypothetical protein CBM2594_U20148 [Cupriavidus taiwanensis]
MLANIHSRDAGSMLFMDNAWVPEKAKMASVEAAEQAEHA